MNIKSVKSIKGTRSAIEVEIDGKQIIITGELTTTPVFYADINSIKHWKPPYENEIITATERNEIIQAIERESKNKKVPVIFD